MQYNNIPLFYQGFLEKQNYVNWFSLKIVILGLNRKK